MSYHHLNAEERIELFKMRANEALSLKEIARRMNRSRSTLSRELRRNTIEPGLYLPDLAQQQAQTRRAASKTAFVEIKKETIIAIKQRLKKYYSPEQISGRLKREGEISISHETIYNLIYANYEGLGNYRQYLRQGRGKRKRREKARDGEGLLAESGLSIDQRLLITKQR